MRTYRGMAHAHTPACAHTLTGAYTHMLVHSLTHTHTHTHTLTLAPARSYTLGCIHTHTHTDTHTHSHSHQHIHAHTHTHTHTHSHSHQHVHTHLDAYTHTHTHTRTHIHTRTNTFMHTHTHTHTDTFTHTLTHTHTHTHARAFIHIHTHTLHTNPPNPRSCRQISYLAVPLFCPGAEARKIAARTKNISLVEPLFSASGPPALATARSPPRSPRAGLLSPCQRLPSLIHSVHSADVCDGCFSGPRGLHL